MPLPIGPFTVPPQPDESGWLARLLSRWVPDFKRPEEHEPPAGAFGTDEEGWQRAHDDAMRLAAEDVARMEDERRRREAELDRQRAEMSARLGYPADSLDGVVTDEPGGGWTDPESQGLIPDPAEASPLPALSIPPMPQVGEQMGPPRDLAFIEELSPSLLRDGRGGRTTWKGVPHQGMVDGAPQQFGTISATMAGPRPSREESRAILAPHAFNAPPAPRAPGPPVPTTVTTSRFDPAKEAFVPIGPPTGDTGVRESYSAVPYDPEGERIRAMEREMQDLELQKARRDAQDPLMRDRFKYEQERALLGDRASIEQMSESDRRQAFMASIQEVDDQAAMAIARIKQSGAPDAAQRIQAVQERADQLKESRRAAFGIGARISSSELYKPRQPAY